MIAVGIIGLGRSGWELHATALAQLPDYRIAGVCDQSPTRLAEAARVFQATPYPDPAALLHDPAIDLVVIAVPGHLHAPLAVKALNAGKHVLVEKPMANTLAEADAMLAAARANQRQLAVFHNRHWDRDFRMVQALAQDGAFGDFLAIEARVMTYGPEWANYGVPEFNAQWRTQAAYGGGFLADWGPHLVGQCLDLAGAWPTSLTCQLRSQLWATEVDDAFYLRLAFESGLLVTIEGSNNARIPLPRWCVVGRDATLVAEGAWGQWTDMRLRKTVAGMTMDLRPREIDAACSAQNYAVGDELSTFFYTDLARALQTGQSPAVSAEFARDVIAVLDAAHRSHDTGSTVSIPVPRASRYTDRAAVVAK